MLARLFPLLLLLITRDGQLHRFDGNHDIISAAPHATALAIVDGKLAILAGARLTFDGKIVPGDFHELRALAGGHRLWALTAAGVSRVDPRSGRSTPALVEPRAHLVAADGDDLFVEHDGVIAQLGAARSWKLTGRPIALAAGDGKLWIATKEGPLWELDRNTNEQHDLGLGNWWGTLALAFGDGQLYAVTIAGKLWRIDPRKREKSIVAMDGWQGALDLAVGR